MTNMIKSVDEPPIWKPTLPPSMRTVPGADQPDRPVFRQDRYPFPYFPPTTNAAVLRSGTIPMPCSVPTRSPGIPLSGVAIISENTTAASFSRFAGSSSAAGSGVIPSAAAIVVAIISFTVHRPSSQNELGLRHEPSSSTHTVALEAHRRLFRLTH